MVDNPNALKVLLLVDNMGLGGAQSLVIDICSAYDRQCLNVLVCALGKRTDMVERLAKLSVEHRVLRIPKWSPFCGRRLRRIAEQFKPDIIYAHLIKSLLTGSMLARHMGAPLVYHEHSDGTIKNLSDAGVGKYLAKTSYAVKRYFTYQANRIITCGPKVADRMLALDLAKGEQVFVIPHGIDLSRFAFSDEDRIEIRRQARQELRIPEDAMVICNVGRFGAGKNWPDFFRVVAQVGDEFPNTRVLAVGDGPLLDEMKTLCGELGLEERTIFTGFRSDVPRLLLASDVMVYTSLRESGPLVVEEAMACGVPVVTYDVGETRSMVREGVDGHVVDNGNAEALARRLRDVLRDPAKRAEFSESCRKRAFAEFDFRLMARRVELVLANARVRHARPHVLGH